MKIYYKYKMGDEYLIKTISEIFDNLFNEIQKYICFTLESEAINKKHFNSYLKRSKIKKMFNIYKIIIDDRAWYYILIYCSLVEYLTENTKSKILLDYCEKKKNYLYVPDYIFKQAQDVIIGKNENISINKNYLRKQKLKQYESR